MDNEDLDAWGTPWPVLDEIQKSDPAQRIADDMRRIKRLRDLIQEKRLESRDSMRKLLLRLLEVDDALDRILSVAPNPQCPSE